MKFQTQTPNTTLPLKTSFRLLTILALLPTLINLASARTCRIVFPDSPNGSPETLSLFDGTRFQQVELPRHNLSPIYSLSDGVIDLRLFNQLPTNAKDFPEGAPSANIPKEFSDCYLILTSDPENPIAPVKIRVVDASSTRLARGEMLWINLTEKTITGTVGDSKINIVPDASEVVKKPREDAGDYVVLLNFHTADEVARYPLCETNWRHDARSRSLVIIARDGKRQAPRVYSFSDFRANKPD